MKKLFTKHLFRAFTLLTLMLTTTLVANAAFHIRGGFDVEANNQWGLGVTMTETSTGVFEGDVTATTGFNFKLYNDYNDKWWGSNAGSIAVSDANGAITMIEDGGGDTYVPCAGTLHFKFISSSHELTITADPRPVSVGSATNGTITVNPTTASPNETVTITLTPATGYYAENVDNNITVQVTGPVGGGNKAPEIGQNLTVTGDAIALPDAPGEYTFTMPAYPFSALVSAKFLPCIELTASMFNPLGYYSWTGGEIKPVPNPAEGSGLTANDYEVTGYANNIDEGTGTASVTVQGKGKYTGTVTLNFSIAKQVHQLTYVQPTTGGTISGPNSAAYTDEITLTANPADGYQLNHFTITYNETTVNLDGNTFNMPDYDVEVTATFTKIPQLYIATPHAGQEDWDKTPMTKQDNGSWVITKTTDEMLAFTFYDQDDHYYGSESQGHYYDIDNTNLGTALPLGTHDPFYIKQAGTWTITVNADLTTVTVTGDWKYNVTTAVVGEGTLVANPTTAAANSVVELTVAPGEGYELASLKVTYGENEIIPTLKEGETTVYEFTMPASDVTATVTYTMTPKLYLTGSFNNWGQGDTPNIEFEKVTTTTGYHWELTIDLAEGTEFKFHDNDPNDWFGAYQWDSGFSDSDPNKYYTWTEARLEQSVAIGKTGNNCNMRIFRDGTWKIVVDADLTAATVYGIKYKHLINIAEGQENNITASVPQAYKDTEVTFTVTAPDGKTIEGVTVTYKVSGTSFDVEVTGSNGSYSFTMPDYDVTIAATFSDVKYEITVGEGVTIVTPANITEAAAGTEITVSVTPANPADFVGVGITVTPTVEVTENADGTFTFTMPEGNVTINAVLEAILHGVMFDSDANRHWATYFGNYNLTAPEGVEVYTVGADYALGEEVPVTKITYIPAKVGVLLYYAGDMVDITTPECEPDGTTYTSALVGSVEPMTLAAFENYILYNDIFVLGEGGTLPAHRCYLPKPAGNSKMRLTLNRPGEGGVITAIEGIDAENVANVKYVNLAGMTSDKPFSGINIMVITRTDGTVETMKIVK